MNGNATLKAQTWNKWHCGTYVTWVYYASESMRSKHKH